jgi:enoyl-CoA hydratase
MDDLGADDNIKVVIITGGLKHFCAGADISEIVSINEVDQAFEFSRRIQGAFDKIENLPKPVVAAVSGFALGGGCELALACDLRIVSETAAFGVPEINIGAVPGAGGTQRLPRLLGVCKAKELLYTGERLTAREACQLGLVNKVVPVDELMDEAKKMAEKLAGKPPLALKMAKQLVNTGMDTDLKSALYMEAHALAYLFLTKDKEEGMKAFLEKRKPTFTGK